MLFNSDNYPQIKQACENRDEIEFEAPIEITAFSSSSAPSAWTAYPPASLPPEGYAQVFALSGPDAKGALIRLELSVYLDGGRILYKSSVPNYIAIKITWPSKPLS